MFWILAAKWRSGTNFLRTVLATHPQIGLHTELFVENRASREGFFYDFCQRRTNNGNAPVIMHPQAPALFGDMNVLLDAYFEDISRRELSRRSAVGIDVKYTEWEAPFLREFLTARNPAIIHVLRRNTLRQLISHFFLQANAFGVEKGSTPDYPYIERVGPKQVRLQLGEPLLKQLKAMEMEKRAFSEFFKSRFKCLEITYEDLVGPGLKESDRIHRPAMERICGFLGVEPPERELTTDYKKVNPTQLHDLVQNLDEGIGFLAMNGFRHCID